MAKPSGLLSLGNLRRRGTWAQGYIGTGVHRHRGTWAQGYMGTGVHKHRGTWAQGYMGTGVHGHRGTWAQGYMGTGVHGHRGTWAQGYMGTGVHWHRGTWAQGYMGTGQCATNPQRISSQGESCDDAPVITTATVLEFVRDTEAFDRAVTGKFTEMDVDGDGLVTRPDATPMLRDVARLLGSEDGDATAAEVFQWMDVDGDGALDKPEFCNGCRCVHVASVACVPSVPGTLAFGEVGAFVQHNQRQRGARRRLIEGYDRS